MFTKEELELLYEALDHCLEGHLCDDSIELAISLKSKIRSLKKD